MPDSTDRDDLQVLIEASAALSRAQEALLRRIQSIQRDKQDDTPELLRRSLAVFDEVDDNRIHSADLARRLGVATQWELAELMKVYGVTTVRNNFVRGGKTLRGYERAAIEAAIERHQQRL